MDIRLLKLSDNKGAKDSLTARDILSIHLGYFYMNGKVTYSTDKAISTQPDYVILVLGNLPICYCCHVARYQYGKGAMFKPQHLDFEKYLPDKYKNDSNISWLVLDSMKEIPKEFLDAVETNKEVIEFITDRANHKKVGL